ncbi:MAG TPA: hypothetical protein VMT24_07925 [Aggregatilineaceae bacterium]|nr:hypothetical protein [Aggregatilineaceae bacterium]
MTNQANASRPSGSRVKPALDTRFHIDYGWWERENRQLRPYLISHLLPEQRGQFENSSEGELMDWVDPDTAEVRRIDALQQALTRAAKDPQYISEHTTLVDAVFRIFLANGNKPLSPRELGERINRPAQVILKTLGGTQIYKGIRPLSD